MLIRMIVEYDTYNQQAKDAHEIINDIYKHAENSMHQSCMVNGYAARLRW